MFGDDALKFLLSAGFDMSASSSSSPDEIDAVIFDMIAAEARPPSWLLVAKFLGTVSAGGGVMVITSARKPAKKRIKPERDSWHFRVSRRHT